jgi:hypothetical protein
MRTRASFSFQSAVKAGGRGYFKPFLNEFM